MSTIRRVTVGLDEITADDDAYHRQCRQVSANVPSTQYLARCDIEHTAALRDRLREFILDTMIEFGIFWFSKDAGKIRDYKGRLYPEIIAHFSSETLSFYLPKETRARRVEHGLVVVREMLPILADAEARLREAQARA